MLGESPFIGRPTVGFIQNQVTGDSKGRGRQGDSVRKTSRKAGFKQRTNNPNPVEIGGQGMGLLGKVGGLADHVVATVFDRFHRPIPGFLVVTQFNEISATNWVGGFELLQTNFAPKGGLNNGALFV
jgi:hypothetical protein